jgi:hypothetical protein
MVQLPTEKSKVVRDITKSLVVCYGRSKIGKTEFWSHADDAIFLATEPGHDEVSINVIDVHNHNEYLEACGLLISNPNSYKTVITDTYDSWVMMIQDWVCNKYNVTHVSDIQNNQGYFFVTQEINRVVTKLAQAFGTVYICNDGWEKRSNKVESYDAHTLDVTGKNRKLILKKANYILLFSTITEGDEEKRVIVTRGSKYYDAGHRGNFLPTTIPLDYGEFIKYFKESK